MDYPFMRTGSIWTIKLPITTVVGGGWSNLYYISLWGHLKIQDIIGVLVCLLCMNLTLMKVMVFSSELFQSSLYMCAVWDGSWRDMNKWLLILDENWWQNLDINKVQFAEPVNFIGVTYRSEWGVTYRLLIMIQWQMHHEIPTSAWAESLPPLSCLVYLRASPSSLYSLIWGGRILVHLVSFRDFLKYLNCLLPGFYRASL